MASVKMSDMLFFWKVVLECLQELRTAVRTMARGSVETYPLLLNSRSIVSITL